MASNTTRYMKLLAWDKQLGLASPLNNAAIHSGKTKNPSTKEAGLDASRQSSSSPGGEGESLFLTSSFIARHSRNQTLS